MFNQRIGYTYIGKIDNQHISEKDSIDFKKELYQKTVLNYINKLVTPHLASVILLFLFPCVLVILIRKDTMVHTATKI